MCENPLYFSYTISEGEFLSIYESDFNLGRLDENENIDIYDDTPTNEPTPMIKLVLTLSLCPRHSSPLRSKTLSTMIRLF